MSDQQIQSITAWLLEKLAEGGMLTPEDLLRQAQGRFSPSDITWAIWYLKSEGKLRLTKDDLIGAA